VILAQAIPKGKAMDLIVQKAVELGVAEIQPLVTRHTVARPDARKAQKWQRVALEACKQCGQDWLPQVREPLEFADWLDVWRPAEGDLPIVASLAEGARPMREVLREGGSPERVVVLVGPEGDFHREETRAAVERGFRPLSLGHLVLRVETASLCCIAAIRYEFSRL
jgi:16S rRNA (uracil1498-N3)-methyltransferase